jgi:hypothetical protein
VPDGEIFGIAGLEFHEFGPCALADGLVVFAAGVHFFVKALHLADRVGIERGAI